MLTTDFTIQSKVGHEYEFKHKYGNFSAIVISKNVIQDICFIAKSENPKWKTGDELIIDSPLTIKYREIYPIEGKCWIPWQSERDDIK
jgi:hypothetical protein